MKKEIVKKFFEFLDRKENKRSVEAVFLLFPETVPEGFVVGGDLDLRDTPIQTLPEGLVVEGDLDLRETPIQTLPEGLKVRRSLYLNDTPIQALPEGLGVGRNLYLSYSSIQSLPEGLKVEGVLFLENTPLSRKYSKIEIKRLIESTGGYVRNGIFIGPSAYEKRNG